MGVVGDYMSMRDLAGLYLYKVNLKRIARYWKPYRHLLVSYHSAQAPGTGHKVGQGGERRKPETVITHYYSSFCLVCARPVVRVAGCLPTSASGGKWEGGRRSLSSVPATARTCLSRIVLPSDLRRAPVVRQPAALPRRLSPHVSIEALRSAGNCAARSGPGRESALWRNARRKRHSAQCHRPGHLPTADCVKRLSLTWAGISTTGGGYQPCSVLFGCAGTQASISSAGPER